MKTFVRIGSLVIALGAAGLLAGCASYRPTRTTQRAATDFEVVETSSKRLLTAKEMIQLRGAVAKYLEKEGVVASGDYYVKVFLTPDKDDVPGDWVVVRFTRDTELRFSLLGSYPAYSNSYQTYAAYDYYPYGYDSFGRISFQYYDDPYYGSRYYYPPVNPRNRNRDHDRRRDADGGRDHDGDRPRHYDRPGDNPVTPPGPPRVNRTRWDSNSPDRSDQPREHNFPHRGESPNRQQPERQTEHSRDSTTSAPVRSESSRSETTSRSSNSYTAPSYSPPVSRPEPRQSVNSEQSPKEANRATAQREHLE